MSEPIDHDALAQRLHRAMTDRAPVPPLREAHPDMDVADAYAVQQGMVRRIMQAGGGRQVGWKIGLTSRPMQEMLGVDQPDYAPVLSSMVFESGHAIPLDEFIQPRVEAEIALVLRDRLEGPGVTAIQAHDAIGGAVAAIEMVDSRIRDWNLSLVDTVADLASSGAAILSDRVVPLDDVDPRLVGMAVAHNGATVATGAGAAALGSPVGAVAWLANTVAAFDVALEPGWFVMTGSLHGAFAVEPGDVVRADFAHLGPVTARFT